MGGKYAITEPQNENIYSVPNFNYVKPNAPNCAFSKANRFPTETSITSNAGINYEYDEYVLSFGKDSANFSNKEPL